MPSLQNLSRKMHELIESQKRDINQLYIISQHTITDIYRANSYAAQLQGILDKITSLLTIYERLRHPLKDIGNKEDRQYAQLLNNISTEVRFLKATNEAMEDTLKKVKQSGDIEQHVSGNIMSLKKQINKTLDKVEQILKDQGY